MRQLWKATLALAACFIPFADAQQQAPDSIPGCVYNATPPTLTNRQTTAWQCDINGKLITNASAAAAALTVGTTTIASGTTTRVLYDNAGVLGEYTNAQLSALVTGLGPTQFAAQNAFTMLGNNTGGSAAPTFFVPTCSNLSNAASSCSTDATNASNISTGTLAAARGGAGTINGALKGNGSGVVSQASCADLSGVAASCATDATNATNITSGSLPAARLNSLNQVTNAMGSDVALNNTANYFDGPSTAQGTTGTWFATGTVTLADSGGAALIYCKLWDGTTVMSSGAFNTTAAGIHVVFTLSGVIASPAANIRISCRDLTAITGVMSFNTTGNSKDGVLTVLRIN